MSDPAGRRMVRNLGPPPCAMAEMNDEAREASRRITEILQNGTPEQIDALIEILEAAERYAVEFEAARQRLLNVTPVGTA